MYVQGFDNHSVATFRQWIAEAHDIVLISHMNADGDACGSILAMSHLIAAHSPHLHSVTPMLPNGCPRQYTWMPGSDGILNAYKHYGRCEAVLAQADLIVVMDMNNAARADNLKEVLLNSTARKVLVDHHHNPAVDQFGILFSDPEISSTCELTLWLALELWGDRCLDRQSAIDLYTGLRTDTGGFSFSCNQPSCFEAAAILISYDIDPTAIRDRLENNFSINRMKFYGFALDQRLQIFPEHHAALFAFSLKDQRQHNVDGEDMEGLVNYTLAMEPIRLGALIREEPGRTKVSLRCKDGLDVNLMAQKLGGGGHTKASGATCYMSFEQTVKTVQQLLLESDNL